MFPVFDPTDSRVLVAAGTEVDRYPLPRKLLREPTLSRWRIAAFRRRVTIFRREYHYLISVLPSDGCKTFKPEENSITKIHMNLFLNYFSMCIYSMKLTEHIACIMKMRNGYKNFGCKT